MDEIKANDELIDDLRELKEDDEDEYSESEYNSSYEETEVDVNEINEISEEEDGNLTINERIQMEWQIRMQDMRRAEEENNINNENINNNNDNNTDNNNDNNNIINDNDNNKNIDNEPEDEPVEEDGENESEADAESETPSEELKNPTEFNNIDQVFKKYVNSNYIKTEDKKDKIKTKEIMEEFNNYMKEKQLINKRFSSKKITKLMGELNYEKSKKSG